MGSEWKEGKLGDYVDSCLGKMLDKNKNKGDFHPYLGNSNVRWGSFDLDDLAEMKFEPSEHSRYGIKAGDLIVCEGGEPGRCAIWEEDIPNMKIQKALHRIRTLKELDSEYLFYWFLYAGRTGLLEAYFTGTTIKHLTGKALKELPIRVPSIERQKQVAQLMRGFDKKIKLNRQINQTLEQMAQTLFKSWFVDFDPVIDNALDAIANGQNIEIPESLAKRFEARKAVRESEGFEPLPADIRQLFPCEFEESELGFVPKGWSVKAISDVAKVTSGKRPPIKSTEKTETETIPVWGGNGIKWYTNMHLFDDKYIITGRVGTLGTVYKVDGLSWASDNALVVNPKENCFFDFIYQVLRDFDISSLNSGSTQPLVTQSALKNISVIVPNESELLKKYQVITECMAEKSQQIDKESIKLESLRDTLLPTLISGELRLDSPQGEALQQAVSAE
ncbi:restriction endonuclease subunit S [Aliivibrio fischeri]|uniref:restriction endonuclease subunit S n=1 Tax=Aliivibrio fischeri TaxID=668 RepID=UPI0012D85DE8|nr:restriction endonuclease subunit S [Aliivibrio fischeri]MUK31502.1 restriction endonuclease subunit S [Aliivibrio fischeri]